jgi:hypothetical protein
MYHNGKPIIIISFFSFSFQDKFSLCSPAGLEFTIFCLSAVITGMPSFTGLFAFLNNFTPQLFICIFFELEHKRSHTKGFLETWFFCSVLDIWDTALLMYVTIAYSFLLFNNISFKIILQLLIHSSINEYLKYFQFLAISNYAVVNFFNTCFPLKMCKCFFLS